MTPCHPLAQTLERVRQFSPYLDAELGRPAGVGWLSVSRDLAPGSARLEELVAATQARLRTSGAAVVASALLQAYQWPVIAVALACYVLDRRVPDLGVASTLVRCGPGGEGERLALLGGRFVALPDDPDAGHPDATVVPDAGALRDALRRGLEAHLGPLIEQLCAHLGCKPRGLWLSAADRCAGTLIWLMQARAADPAQIEAELDALVRAPDSPLSSRQIGLIELGHGGRSQLFLNRATCCYWYKTEGGDYCDTCPRLRPEERRARLLASLAAQAVGAGALVEEEAVA